MAKAHRRALHAASGQINQRSRHRSRSTNGNRNGPHHRMMHDAHGKRPHKQVDVRLKPKDPNARSEADLEAMAGEFANELLNQLVRIRVGDATRDLREYYMARAFFGDDSSSSIDALLAELDAEELAEDELEVAVPWEDSTGA